MRTDDEEVFLKKAGSTKGIEADTEAADGSSVELRWRHEKEEFKQRMRERKRGKVGRKRPPGITEPQRSAEERERPDAVITGDLWRRREWQEQAVRHSCVQPTKVETTIRILRAACRR